MRTITRRATLAVTTLLAASVLASCGGSDGASDTTAAATDAVTVTKQWARTSAEGAEMGAAYMHIVVTADDELVGAAVDMSVAMEAQIHEMVMSGGNMTMQEVDSIPAKAGEMLELEPGGYHVMLMGLKKPLVTGETISVTLKFAKAGDVVVEVPVQEDAPA